MATELTVKVENVDHLLGTFLDESHYDTLIDFDVDVYREMDEIEFQTHHGKNGEHNIICKFRKKYFTKEQQELAYEGLKDAAHPTFNRGMAAGPIGKDLKDVSNREWVTHEQIDVINYLMNLGSSTLDTDDVKEQVERIRAIAKTKKNPRGMVWLTTEMEKHKFKFNKWVKEVVKLSDSEIKDKASWVYHTLISDTVYANRVDSGIAGWFDRYPRIPYGRPTAYTFHHPEKFAIAYPFLEALGKAFKKLLPLRYSIQMSYIKRIDPSFYVPNTPFTTITVNRNFRTAAHYDAGDLSSGFSNLTVIAKDKSYKGAYLVVPGIRAAINIRPGDLLLVGNHNYIHGNTPIECEGNAEDFERISVVCYFRENMINLGERRYEDLRYQFVESRRANTEHPLWKEGWNGVSHAMWDTKEWYDFLRDNDGEKYIAMYHAKSLEVDSNLNTLFEEI